MSVHGRNGGFHGRIVTDFQVGVQVFGVLNPISLGDMTQSTAQSEHSKNNSASAGMVLSHSTMGGGLVTLGPGRRKMGVFDVIRMFCCMAGSYSLSHRVQIKYISLPATLNGSHLGKLCIHDGMAVLMHAMDKLVMYQSHFDRPSADDDHRSRLENPQ